MSDDTGKAGQKAVFDLNGATCMSCMYTIEHLGRKLDGVRDVYVNVKDGIIEVEYDPEQRQSALEGIPEIVRRIGYQATLRPPDRLRPPEVSR
jgi:copper chaperone CopZ